MAKSYAYLMKKAGFPLEVKQRVPAPIARIKPVIHVPQITLASSHRQLSPQAEELFCRLFAQLGGHEEGKNFSAVYELAIKLFPYLFGKMPCDVPRFKQLREIVAKGETVPLFESASRAKGRE